MPRPLALRHGKRLISGELFHWHVTPRAACAVVGDIRLKRQALMVVAMKEGAAGTGERPVRRYRVLEKPA